MGAEAPYFILHSPFGAVTAFTKYAYYQSVLAFLVMAVIVAMALIAADHPFVGLLF